MWPGTKPQGQMPPGQILAYENLCGILLHRNGLYSWRCPCGRSGRSRKILKKHRGACLRPEK